MKIFIISSASFYDKISPIREYLINKGYEVLLPNTYDNPNLEKETWEKDLKYMQNLKKNFLK